VRQRSVVESNLMPLQSSNAFAQLMPAILIFIVILVVMSLVTRRQEKKRNEDRETLESSLHPGDRVLLHSGVIVTVDTIGDKQLWVELAPDVKVVVLKAAVMRKVTDSEEEFIVAEDQPEDIDEPAENSAQEAPADPTEGASEDTTAESDDSLPDASTTVDGDTNTTISSEGEYPSAGEQRD